MIKTYLVTLSADGDATRALLAPTPEPRKERTVVVRAETANKAKRIAEDLFSLAK